MRIFLICVQVSTVLRQMRPASRRARSWVPLRSPGQEGLQATVRKKEGEKARDYVASSFFVSGELEGLTVSFLFSF